MRKTAALVLMLVSMALLVVACAGGDDQPSPEPTSETPPVTTPAVEPTEEATTGPSIGVLSPPLEGPQRPAQFSERTNYWELEEYQLPVPDDLPEPPTDATGLEYKPPAEPTCPQDWEFIQRPVEGFKICYPQTWLIEGHGYVSSSLDDRYYSIGFFLFDGDRQLAHVSVYVQNAYALPYLYTRDCEQAYRVTYAGSPAVLCPDLSGLSPEGKIITYQLRRDELDYFVNIVPYFSFDEDEGYLDTWPVDIEEEALRVAQTFQFVPRSVPGE